MAEYCREEKKTFVISFPIEIYRTRWGGPCGFSIFFFYIFSYEKKNKHYSLPGKNHKIFKWPVFCTDRQSFVYGKEWRTRSVIEGSVLMNLRAIIRNPDLHKVDVEWVGCWLVVITQLTLRAQQWRQFSYNAHSDMPYV